MWTASAHQCPASSTFSLSVARGGVMVTGAQSRSDTRSRRRRRLLTRIAPLGAIALVAFVVGAIAGGAGGRAEKRLVSRYVNAWAHGDYAQMYSLLDSSS